MSRHTSEREWDDLPLELQQDVLEGIVSQALVTNPALHDITSLLVDRMWALARLVKSADHTFAPELDNDEQQLAGHVFGGFSPQVIGAVADDDILQVIQEGTLREQIAIAASAFMSQRQGVSNLLTHTLELIENENTSTSVHADIRHMVNVEMLQRSDDEMIHRQDDTRWNELRNRSCFIRFLGSPEGMTRDSQVAVCSSDFTNMCRVNRLSSNITPSAIAHSVFNNPLLSTREAKFAGSKTNWMLGADVYEVPPYDVDCTWDDIEASGEICSRSPALSLPFHKGIRMVTGPSPSILRLLQLGRYFNFTHPELSELRLLAIHWLTSYRQHSLFECAIGARDFNRTDFEFSTTGSAADCVFDSVTTNWFGRGGAEKEPPTEFLWSVAEGLVKHVSHGAIVGLGIDANAQPIRAIKLLYDNIAARIVSERANN